MKILWKTLIIITLFSIFDMLLSGMSQSKFFLSLYKFPILFYTGYGLNILASYMVVFATYSYYYKND